VPQFGTVPVVAIRCWEDYAETVALMTPGDTEVDPCERSQRHGAGVDLVRPTRAGSRQRPPVEPGHGTAPGPCGHCGTETAARRRQGLCEACYRRSLRARRRQPAA
jgi:hypothetical protein